MSRRGWTLVFLAALIAGISIYAAARAEQVYRHQNTLIQRQNHLINENQQRIKDLLVTQKAIQKSRLESCIQSYDGVRKIFEPLIPANPQGVEKQRIDEYKKHIRDLKRQCPEQVRPSKER